MNVDEIDLTFGLVPWAKLEETKTKEFWILSWFKIFLLNNFILYPSLDSMLLSHNIVLLVDIWTIYFPSSPYFGQFTFSTIALLSLSTNHICCFRNCSPSWHNRLSLRITLFLDESLSLSLSLVLSVALFWTNKYSFLEHYSPSLRSMISGSPACRAVLMCVAALELDVSEIILDQQVVLRSLGQHFKCSFSRTPLWKGQSQLPC